MNWVLKNNSSKAYLAPTYRTKYGFLAQGDCVTEQVYALRYEERNAAAKTAVELNGLDGNAWRIVRLLPKSKPPRCISCSGSGKLVRVGHGYIICPTCKGKGHLGAPESRGTE